MIQVDRDIIEINKRFQNEYNLKAVLELLNNPQINLPTISVVGTNGKGSTSFYLSKGLKNKYKKVGLFTSPAFIYHNERIQINNKPISDKNLLNYIKKTKKYSSKYNLTFFEIWTLVAILYFCDQKVDIVVMEAGIGGIKDSTSLMSNQLLVAVTSISFDHMEILGSTIEEIISQKVNIAKPNVDLVISKDNVKYESIIKKNLINKNKIIWSDEIEDEVNYQKANKGLVKTILKIFDIENDEIFKLQPPLGRFTLLNFDSHKIIIDGAHNVDGIKQLIKSIESKNIKVIYGAVKGKEHDKILKILNSNFKEVYVTQFDHFKSWNIEKIDYENKIYDLKHFIKEANSDLLICGSLYFAPKAYQIVKKLQEQGDHVLLSN